MHVLHSIYWRDCLAFHPKPLRDEQYIKYVRGLDNATDMVANGEAQLAFLLEATTFSRWRTPLLQGGCMPQKSTDFYPKLLTGLTIYKLEK